MNRLIFANLGAQSAEQIALTAAPVIAVLLWSAGPGASGLLQAVQTMPYVLFALPLGVLADRVPRRLLIATAETVRALSLAVIILLATLGKLNLPLLGIVGFVGASGTIAFQVAAPSLVRGMAAPDDLPRANGRVELARTVAFMGGPPLAGILVGRGGPSAAFAIASGLSILAVIAVVRLPEPERLPYLDHGRSTFSGVLDATGFTFGHVLLRPVLMTQMIFNAAWFALMAVFVPYAIHQLALSTSTVGLTLGLNGLGLLVGALMAPMVMRRLKLGTTILIGPLCGLTAGMLMASTIILPCASLAAISLVLFGIGPMLWIISTTTLRQRLTPPEMLGRVTALYVVATSSRTIGALISAIVGSISGTRACLILAALMFVVQAALIIASPVRGFSVEEIRPGVRTGIGST